MNFFALSGLINGIISSVLGIFVFTRNKKDIRCRTYALFCLAISVWSYFYFFWLTASQKNMAILYSRGLMAGAIFIPITYFHHLSVILGVYDKKKKIIFYGYLAGLVSLILDFTPFFVKDVTPKLNFKFWPNPGITFHPFLILWIWYVVYGIFMIISQYKNSTGLKKEQLKYILLATFIGWGGGATNYPLWYNVPMLPLGNIFVSGYMLILAYAILRYRFMDINIALTRAGIFAFVYTLVLGIPFWLGYITKSWFPSTALAVFLATLGPFIYSYLRRKAETRIFQEEYRAHGLLAKATDGMTRIRDLKKLLGLITHFITKLLKVRNAAIYLLDSQASCYVLKSARLLKDISKTEPLDKETNPLIQYLTKTKSALVYDELNTQAQQEANEEFASVVQEMHKINAAVIIPSFVEEFLLGFLVLEERKDNRIYTQENLNVLQVLANQAALAIENAVFYEETGKSLADSFHESRLRSIGTLGAGIGHQINNRFNAIAIPSQIMSMKIEKKDINKLSPDELKELLSESIKSFDSITADALRGGKIATSLTSFSRKTEGYQAISFAKVMDEVLNLLSCKFKLEELNLKQDISQDGKPLWGNLSQLDDVFFNLLDNAHDAIKKLQSEAEEGNLRIAHGYQPKVQLKAVACANKRLEITLEDNGIGMTEEQLTKLFIPFFTTKATSGKGTGLGLWIIKQIVEAHNGTIGIESTYGKGTKFIINLPLATKEQIESKSNSNSKENHQT